MVNSSGNKYRDIFTKSSEKIKIELVIPDIDIGLFNDVVRNLLPNPQVYNKFFPAWPEEKLPPLYLQSLQGLFAEMVQQFYSCVCTRCSCPKVRVLGLQED